MSDDAVFPEEWRTELVKANAVPESSRIAAISAVLKRWPAELEVLLAYYRALTGQGRSNHIAEAVRTWVAGGGEPSQLPPELRKFVDHSSALVPADTLRQAERERRLAEQIANASVARDPLLAEPLGKYRFTKLLSRSEFQIIYAGEAEGVPGVPPSRVVARALLGVQPKLARELFTHAEKRYARDGVHAVPIEVVERAGTNYHVYTADAHATLHEAFGAGSALDTPSRLSLLKAVASQVDALHKGGAVHGDLQPQYVLWRKGDRPHAWEVYLLPGWSETDNKTKFTDNHPRLAFFGEDPPATAATDIWSLGEFLRIAIPQGSPGPRSPFATLVDHACEAAKSGGCEDTTAFLHYLALIDELEYTEGKLRLCASYQFSSYLGAGSCGVVFQASRGSKQRAVKVLRPAARARDHVAARFGDLRLCNVDSPNLARVFRSEVIENVHLAEMELLSGVSLGEWARAVARDSEELEEDKQRGVIARLVEVAEGCAAIHLLGRAHLDIKPDNVLVVQERDGRPRAKLLDYRLGPEGNGPALFYTREYAAPEVTKTQQGSRAADVFSLGKTGRSLFESAGLPVPAPLDELFSQMMHDDPEERPDIVNSYFRLKELRGGWAESHEETPAPRPGRWRAVSALLLLATIAFAVLWQRAASRDEVATATAADGTIENRRLVGERDRAHALLRERDSDLKRLDDELGAANLQAEQLNEKVKAFESKTAEELEAERKRKAECQAATGHAAFVNRGCASYAEFAMLAEQLKTARVRELEASILDAGKDRLANATALRQLDPANVLALSHLVTPSKVSQRECERAVRAASLVTDALRTANPALDALIRESALTCARAGTARVHALQRVLDTDANRTADLTELLVLDTAAADPYLKDRSKPFVCSMVGDAIRSALDQRWTSEAARERAVSKLRAYERQHACTGEAKVYVSSRYDETLYYRFVATPPGPWLPTDSPLKLTIGGGQKINLKAKLEVSPGKNEETLAIELPLQINQDETRIASRLLVTTRGRGNGTITFRENGQTTGSPCTPPCSIARLINRRAIIDIEAIPDASSEFLGWDSSGKCPEGPEPCEYALSRTAHSVAARFARKASVTLSAANNGTLIAKRGLAAGCSSSCLATEVEVEIVPQPDPGYEFARWIGCPGDAEAAACVFRAEPERSYAVAAQFRETEP